MNATDRTIARLQRELEAERARRRALEADWHRLRETEHQWNRLGKITVFALTIVFGLAAAAVIGGA